MKKPFSKPLSKPLLKRYVFSFLLVGLIPVVAFGILFFYSNILGLKSETRRFSYALLTQVQNKFDFMNEELTNIALHLSSREDAAWRGADGTIDKAQLAAYLRSYEESVSVPATILYYERGADYVVLKEGVVKYRQFEDTLDRFDSFAFSAFFSKLNRISQETATRVMNTSVLAGGDGKSWIAFLYPVPVLAPLPTGTLAFLIERREIEKIMANYFGDMDFHAFILDRHREVVFSNTDWTADEIGALFRSERGVGVYDHAAPGGAKTIQLRTISENTDFAFLLSIADADFYGAAIRNLNLLAFISIALVLFGFVLAVSMAYSNYRPISRLLARIGGSTANRVGENELDTLELYWQKTKTDLESQQAIVRNLILRKFVQGDLQEAEQTEQYLRSSGIFFSHPWFFIALLRGADAGHSEPGHQELVHSIDNAAIDGARFFAIESMNENDLTILANISVRESEASDPRETVLRSLTRELEQRLGVGFKVAAGGLYSNPTDSHRSFIEALVALQGAGAEPNDSPRLYSDSAGSRNESSAWPVVGQAVLLQALKRGDPRTAESAIDDIFEDIGTRTKDPFLSACLAYDIVNTMIKIGSAFQGSDEMLNAFRQLPAVAESPRFMEITKRVARWICTETKKAKEEEGTTLKNALIRYLNDHFCDKDLSLEKVAEAFSLTPAYLSRFLKSETGYGFVQYVTILRMDYIKDRLVSADGPIQVIIQSAGYGDVANFIRKFKLNEGITPGQYRSLMREKRV